VLGVKLALKITDLLAKPLEMFSYSHPCQWHTNLHRSSTPTKIHDCDVLQTPLRTLKFSLARKFFETFDLLVSPVLPIASLDAGKNIPDHLRDRNLVS